MSWMSGHQFVADERQTVQSPEKPMQRPTLGEACGRNPRGSELFAPQCKPEHAEPADATALSPSREPGAHQ